MDTLSDFDHRIFSVAEAAQHLRISRAFLYELIAAKRIKPFKLGTRSLITGKEIVRFLATAERAV
jgi:excisionase family DNA binding protein